MFRITLSNRCEYLLDALCEQFGDACGDPFEPLQVIVPSAALQRHIELALADRLGICANVEFSYLGSWLWRQIGRLVPVAPDTPFAAARLAWRIYALFGERAFTARHERLSTWLAAADPGMRLDLARRSAQLIEQYITYRPDWLDIWQRGAMPGDAAIARHPDAAWQADLWRQICAALGVPPHHPAEVFFRRLDDDPGAAAQLPRSAAVFALPALPPAHLHLLGRLGRHIDIRLYMHNPCQEYWFDLVDRSRLTWLQARGRADYHETGHSLLAAWGKQSKSCLGLVLSEDIAQALDQDSRFVALTGTHRLARLHNAILDLAEPAPGSQPAAADDRSVELHVCHSSAREIEVLHDQLLARFAADPSLRAQDILVATPDLDTAAPLIDAVFGQAPPERRIPYSITGRAARGENPIARALADLLALARGRHNASAVFGLLQQEPVAERFDLDAADLDTLRDWMREAGIRWALDADDKLELGLPPAAIHSFDDGLQRLFLAYALGDAAALCAGRNAAGNPEGLEALLLGRFAHYVEWLRRIDRAWAVPMPAAEWQAALLAALDRLVPQDGVWLDAAAEVRAGLGELFDAIRSATPDLALPLEVVRDAVAELYARPARGGVPSGAVTFAAMGALRGLPYRVVCLLGMNDGVFPGTARAAEFDLMAAAPRPGDRQRRDDERNLFLDLVLAARDALIITCTGRSQRDASPLPPSVLVAELLDYLATAAADPGQPAAWQAARCAMIVEHPLQPFAAAYFRPGGDPRLISYKREYFDAQSALAQAAAGAARPAPPGAPQPAEDDAESAADEDAAPAVLFFRGPLPAPQASWQSVELDALLRFFRNPCRCLLERRLDIALSETPEEIADDEIFLADFPGRQALAQRLLPAALAGRGSGELRALAAAGIEYPHGTLGGMQLEQELTRICDFAAALTAATAIPARAPASAQFDYPLEGANWRLQGSVTALRGTTQVLWRYDDTRATDYLAAWIKHLFACAAAPDLPLRTAWHSRDGRFELATVADARSRLGELLDMYRRGLSEPLYFFPKSAWAYAVHDGSYYMAMQRWTGRSGSTHGESYDPAYRLALRGVESPLAQPEFAACAMSVYTPLLQHLDDPRLA